LFIVFPFLGFIFGFAKFQLFMRIKRVHAGEKNRRETLPNKSWYNRNPACMDDGTKHIRPTELDVPGWYGYWVVCCVGLNV
jgi:hypothetical protein